MWGRKGSAAAALRHPHPRPAAPAGALPSAPCHLEKFKAWGHGDGGGTIYPGQQDGSCLSPRDTHACVQQALRHAHPRVCVCVYAACGCGCATSMCVRVRVCVCLCVCVRGEGSGAGTERSGREGGRPAAPAHPPRRGERRLTRSPWSLKVKLRLVS